MTYSSYLSLPGSDDGGAWAPIDFQFASEQTIADQASSPALGTITFTRSGATATRVNESGLIETVAADTPRFDFDPTTLECKGLLIEEVRTNLCLRSEDFSTTWTPGNIKSFGAGSTTDAAIAPDGNETADLITEDTTASATHGVAQAFAKAASALAYSFSVFVKQANGTRNVEVEMTASNGGAFFYVNPSTGAVVVSAGTFGTAPFTAASGRVETFSDGWYRVTLTATSNTATNLNAIVRLASGGSDSYSGDGSSGVYLWGAQLEVGAFPTSYIPTASAAATRNADVMTAAVGSWTNEAAQTIYYEFSKDILPQGGSNTAMVIARTNNARAGYITSVSAVLNGFDGTNIVSAAGNIAAGSVARGAYAVDASGQALARDGGVVATAAFDGTWDSGQAFALGCNNVGGNSLNGHLRRFTYFPKRLANATLQDLSADGPTLVRRTSGTITATERRAGSLVASVSGGRLSASVARAGSITISEGPAS